MGQKLPLADPGALPGESIAEHGGEHAQYAPGTGDQRHLAGPPDVELGIMGPDHRVASRRRHRHLVERPADGGATAPDHPMPLGIAAIPRMGRHPGQCGDGAPVEGPQLGEPGEQDRTDHGTDAGDGLELAISRSTWVHWSVSVAVTVSCTGLVVGEACCSRFCSITRIVTRSARQATNSVSVRTVSLSTGVGAGCFCWA